MIKDKVIVCISPIDWDFLWQRHQIIMESFARNGNTVFYIENLTPALNLSPSIFFKILKRIKKILFRENLKESKKIPGLTIITPFVLPFKNRFAEFINKKVFIRLLCLFLQSRGAEKPILWTYMATPAALQLIADIKPRFLVYDCVFDATAHPDHPRDAADLEKQLIKSAGLIFTDNHLLFRRCAQFNPKTYLEQPGVDFELFARQQGTPVSRAFQNINKPRICFFGGIDQIRIDLELIKHIAKNRQDWNIVLFGPVIKTDISSLKLKNIFFLGTLKHEELPAYLEKVDVLILPYKIIPFSDSIFPAKIFECLATRKPVVSTPLPELTEFPENIIKIAAGNENFVLAIENSLNSINPDDINKRLALARENSWTKRLTDIQSIMEETLKNKRE